MPKLLYHAAKVAVSPFDDAILQVAKTGTTLRLVSPYIGIGYLERVLEQTTDWRLVSDVQEWLSALARKARPSAWQFIRENLNRIHHCPALHAKAVIGESLAMLGSANLTRTGILGRTELGVLFEEPAQVVELCGWFDKLWDETASLTVEEADAFVQWLDAEAEQGPIRRAQFEFSPAVRKVRAKLVKLPTKPKQNQDSALTLGVIAQEVITSDQKRCDSLDHAFQIALDALTATGDFSFSDLVREARKYFDTVTAREVYLLAVQQCANHRFSVFSEDTKNRLILLDHKFVPSSKDLLTKALEPFDRFLVTLVQHLSFVEARRLLPEIAQARSLLSALQETGFLDIQYSLVNPPQYLLLADFYWDGRFKFFPRARAIWNTKLAKEPPKAIVSESLPATILDSDPEQNFTHPARRRPSKSELRRAWDLEHEAIDSFHAKVIDMLANGHKFTPAPCEELIRNLARITEIAEKYVMKAFLQKSRRARILLLEPIPKSDHVSVGVNSGFSKFLLLQYPKTRAVCEKLLGPLQI